MPCYYQDRLIQIRPITPEERAMRIDELLSNLEQERVRLAHQYLDLQNVSRWFEMIYGSKCYGVLAADGSELSPFPIVLSGLPQHNGKRCVVTIPDIVSDIAIVRLNGEPFDLKVETLCMKQ